MRRSLSEVGAGAPGSRAVLVYNVARLALLVLCLGLGWVAGLRGALLLVVALVVSGVLSWFLLTEQRVAVGMALERALGTPSRTKAPDAPASGPGASDAGVGVQPGDDGVDDVVVDHQAAEADQ